MINEIDVAGTTQTKPSEGFSNARLQRGLDIAKKGDQIVELSSTRYVVKSQKTDDEYEVITRIGWYCSCPDYMFRGVICKHMYAILFKQNHNFEQSESPVKNLLEEACNKIFETNFS
jgi:predicted nucleic acid-binding Zn finger protein